MCSIIRFTRASLRLVIIVAGGALLVVLLYIIKSPESPTTKTAGVARFYRWFHKETSALPEPGDFAALEHEKILQSEPGDVTRVEDETILQPGAESNVQEEILPMQQEESTQSGIEAYCMKCRQKRSMLMAKQVTTRNGRHAVEGTCPICSTKLFRFI